MKTCQIAPPPWPKLVQNFAKSKINLAALINIIVKKFEHPITVTRFGDLLDFGQLFKAFGNH